MTNIFFGMIHPISINTEQVEQEKKSFTYISLDAFSRPERGDNRKKVRKVGPSKIYLQVIKVYLMKIKGYCRFLNKIQVLKVLCHFF